MIQFPNAKINLGLHITQKRNDGYHDIETIFYPIALFDTLEFIESNTMHLQTYGVDIPGDIDQNIIIKAYQCLQIDFPKLPKLDICLLKKIPTGAGLGGGSADAAFMLMMLNKHFQLQIEKEKMLQYAALLGSDCAFFIHNQPCFATGRGEKLSIIHLDLSQYSWLIINPNIHIATPWAFQLITPTIPKVSLVDIVKEPVHTWPNLLVNDFEKPIMAHYPLLREIKHLLYKNGALYASMSGSGSSLFGLFADKQTATKVSSLFSSYQTYIV